VSSLNLLRVGSYPTRLRTGMGFHSYQVSLIKDIKTYYLTPALNEDYLENPENIELIKKNFFLKIRPKGVSLFKTIPFLFMRVISILLFSFHGIVLLKVKKIDIVHIHSPMFMIIAYFSYLFRKKTYITFHGTDFHRIKKSFLYKKFSYIFDKVFIISEDMAEELIKIHGKEKILLVRNGVDFNLYINKNLKRKKQIIAVGSLKEEKGFTYLIQAFCELMKENIEYKKYKLVIAGNGLLYENLQNQININNMQDNIILLGHKSTDEIINLYNESELFILSSVSEGFPKVILEAMSCGCKIISTSVGSVPSILENTDYYIIKPKDIAELKISIVNSLKRNNIDYSKIVKSYSWESVRSIYKLEYEREKCIH